MDSTAAPLLPPLKPVTATDQGAVLAITASMGLVVAVVSLLIRAFVRRECHAAFAKDDAASVLSLIIAIIQSSVVFSAIKQGFGKASSELSPGAMAAWMKSIYASDILFVCGMWVSKCAIALLLMRLSRDPTHTAMARTLLVASSVYFVVSIFVVSLRCQLSRPWDLTTSGCPASTFSHWAAVTALDAITEAALFLGSVWLVRDLQLPWRKKSVVVVAYGLRLPVIVAAALHLHYLNINNAAALASSANDTAPDPSLHGILAAVCLQIELCYAVVATTLPCLRPFMAALNTQYGGGPACIVISHHQTTTSIPATARSRTQGSNIGFGSIIAKTMVSDSSKSRPSTDSEIQMVPTLPTTTNTTNTATSHDRRGSHTSSAGEAHNNHDVQKAAGSSSSSSSSATATFQPRDGDHIGEAV